MQELIVKYSIIAFPYLVRFRYFIIAAAVIGIFVFGVLRIDTTLQIERNELRFIDETAEINEVVIDEEAVRRIRDLEASNASIDANLPSNTNPFN